MAFRFGLTILLATSYLAPHPQHEQAHFRGSAEVACGTAAHCFWLVLSALSQDEGDLSSPGQNSHAADVRV